MTSIENGIVDIEDEDLIPVEECVVTMTHFGYVKRLPSSTYKSQHRGGRGISGLSTRDEDFVENIFVTSSHNYILFFTNKGRMYKLKTYQIPEAGRQAKGSAIVNLLPIEKDEKITAVIPIKEFEENKYLTMLTKRGVIKKTDLTDYDTIRKGGLIAIGLREDDELIHVELTDGDNNIIVGTKKGICIRFKESDVRPMGRGASGVKAITLNDDDFVVGAGCCKEGADILTITENGYGKKTDLEEFKIQNRGGKGLFGYKITEKTGDVAGLGIVNDDNDVMIITSDGVIIRTAVDEISKFGRTTQGVRVMRLADDVKVVSITTTDKEEENDEINDAETEENPQEITTEE